MSRLRAKTPKWFRVIRNISAALAVASGAILAAPVALPVALVTAAGYVAFAATTVAAVAQTAKDGE